MIGKNREFRMGVIFLAAVSAVLTVFAFFASTACGLYVLAACLLLSGIHILTEVSRYRALQSMSRGLDALLESGTPLAIREYREGELSILANQIQKLALRLTEYAQRAQAEKNHLADSLADISHQLRTPLTAMNLTATMLRSPELTEEKRNELTGELRRLLDRTDWLVETLLKLSKLDAGTVRLAKAPVAVEKLIHRAAQPLAIGMDLRSQQLVVHCGQECFTGDLVWTAEALGNVLKNCMEHTPEGGQITVTAQETPLFTQIAVEDTGTGFAEKDVPHLFERFYKGSTAAESSYGIGLALARTVIAGQNGTIQAMNGSGGARFVIKFYKQVI